MQNYYSEDRERLREYTKYIYKQGMREYGASTKVKIIIEIIADSVILIFRFIVLSNQIYTILFPIP